jgi:hypothetical protein
MWRSRPGRSVTRKPAPSGRTATAQGCSNPPATGRGRRRRRDAFRRFGLSGEGGLDVGAVRRAVGDRLGERRCGGPEKGGEAAMRGARVGMASSVRGVPKRDRPHPGKGYGLSVRSCVRRGGPASRSVFVVVLGGRLGSGASAGAPSSKSSSCAAPISSKSSAISNSAAASSSAASSWIDLPEA